MRISTTQFNTNGLNSILDQQAALSETQLQVASEKAVLKPSDDPVATSQIINFKQEISITEQYIENADRAEVSLVLEETTLANAIDVLRRVRDLMLQGNNGTYNQGDRRLLASEINSRLEEVLGLANTRINGGEFLYAGFQTGTQPFTKNAAGGYNYNGDQGERRLQLSSSIEVTIVDSGYEVFNNIRTGNGSFYTEEDVNNAGSGVISSGFLADTAAYVPDDYTINYLNNGGNLVYQIEDGTGTVIIPPSGLLTDSPSHTENAEIRFNGISVAVAGIPAAGDSFTVAPSVNQNLFTTLEQSIDALNLPDQTDELAAVFRNRMDSALSNIDQAIEHLAGLQSEVGTRINVVESQKDIGESFIVELRSSLSLVEDLDLAEAITRLTRQTNSLQAAQQSYVRIQNLTLFDFIQ